MKPIILILTLLSPLLSPCFGGDGWRQEAQEGVSSPHANMRGGSVQTKVDNEFSSMHFDGTNDDQRSLRTKIADTEYETFFAAAMGDMPANICPLAPGMHHRQTAIYQYDSDENDKHAGVVVSMSTSGHRVAVLRQLLDESGIVHLYERGDTEGEWVQLGDGFPIIGRLQNEWWAFSRKQIALSANGRTLAIASPYADPSTKTGQVDVYEYRAGSWRRRGSGPITGIDSPRFSMSVDIVAGGYLVAVGTDTKGNGSLSGYVRLYNDLGDWTQSGNDLEALDSTETNFGSIISLSQSGTRIAASFSKIAPDGTLSGMTRVFESGRNIWTPVGRDIEDGGAIDLSYLGTVLVVRTNSYFYDYSDGEWGPAIPIRERLGSGTVSVSLNEDGNRVAIADALRATNRGRVQIFEYYDGVWCKILQRLGDEPFVNFGYGLSMSGNGDFYAVGAPYIQYYFRDSYWQVVEIQDDRETFVCPEAGENHSQKSIVRYDATGDDKYVGAVLSMSSDGNRVASLTYQTDGTAVVRVYEESSPDNWIQLGRDFNVIGVLENSFTLPRKQISLSGNGRFLAIASPYSDVDNRMGQVDIYTYSAGNWIRSGNGPITGFDSPKFTMSVELADGGHAIAVGTDRGGTNGRNDGEFTGYIRMYIRDAQSDWVQIGDDIEGSNQDETDYGTVLAYAGNGNMVAISFNKIDNRFNLIGFTRVYRFQQNTWPQMGNDIPTAIGVNGGAVTAISYDGRILAVGTETFFYNDELEDWVGPSPIREEFRSGLMAVELSRDGTRVAVADANRRNNRGRVQVYDYINREWCKVVQRLGDRDGVNYAHGLSMSDDGERYASGAPYIQTFSSGSYWEVVEIREA